MLCIWQNLHSKYTVVHVIHIAGMHTLQTSNELKKSSMKVFNFR